MKVLQNLTGAVTEQGELLITPRLIVQCKTESGAILLGVFGVEGVLITGPNDQVLIPMTEIFRLAAPRVHAASAAAVQRQGDLNPPVMITSATATGGGHP